MADRLHLQPKHRRMLESLLREHLPEVEVWAYGSRVTGRSHDGSDLDLVLRGPGLKKIPADKLVDFEDAIRESNIPFLVEARDWARLPERFHREIGRNHVSVVRPLRREVALGEIAEFQEGYVNPPQSKAEYFNGPIKWLRANDLNNSFVFETSRTLSEDGYRSAGKSATLFPPNTLAISKSGTIGRLGILKDWMCGNRAVINIKPLEQLAETRYVYYALMSDSAQIDILADGSVQRNLYVSQLSTFRMYLPDLPEQRAIAHILGTLDDKIELNRRMNETLEAMAQALFKSWFVDFEPVRAKTEGAEVRLPHHVSRLFPDSYDDSALGNVPRRWKVVELTELIDVNPRRPSLRKGESALYVPMSSMPISGHTPSRVSHRPFGSGTRFINGDTLLARITPCLENGKTAYVDFLKEGQVGWGSTEYIILRPKPFLPSEFAYCLARSSGFRDFAIQSMTGTSGRQRVQPAALGQFLMPRPPERVGKEFGRLTRPMIRRALLSANESGALAELRDTLLPKLISGEIRIADAEKAVESVA